MKILMATDGASATLAALRTASRLLSKQAERVDVLCVAAEFHLPKGKEQKAHVSGLHGDYERRMRRETERIVAQTQTILREEGITAGARTEFGSPAEVIARLSNEYDVMVLGATGRDEHRRLGLGPVASRVVERAPGVVLIARGEMPVKRLKILVGVDGSRASARALEALAAYFNLAEAEVTLMHVRETPWTRVGLERDWFAVREEAGNTEAALRWEKEMRAEAEELIEAARDQLRDYPVTIITNSAEGNPGTELLGEAEAADYDLIVVGATGVSDIKHSLLGSVSTKLAWYAPCSVAVIRKS
jgi:nucleotide-binding universal stress UspA family protein